MGHRGCPGNSLENSASEEKKSDGAVVREELPSRSSIVVLW